MKKNLEKVESFIITYLMRIGNNFYGGEYVNMTTTKEIILNFENFMKKSGWTQDVAAEKLGCSAPHLSRLLRGERNPSMKILDKMESIYKEWSE